MYDPCKLLQHLPNRKLHTMRATITQFNQLLRHPNELIRTLPIQLLLMLTRLQQRHQYLKVYLL